MGSRKLEFFLHSQRNPHENGHQMGRHQLSFTVCDRTMAKCYRYQCNVFNFKLKQHSDFVHNRDGNRWRHEDDGNRHRCADRNCRRNYHRNTIEIQGRCQGFWWCVIIRVISTGFYATLDCDRGLFLIIHRGKIVYIERGMSSYSSLH